VIYHGDELGDELADRLPSSVFGINIVTGGGLPYNRITEIEGPPSTFKTTLTLDFCKQMQMLRGKQCNIAWIPTEDPPDIKWARHLGVKIPYAESEIEALKRLKPEKKVLDAAIEDQRSRGEFFLLRDESVARNMNVVKRLLHTGGIDLYVIDSIGSVTSEAEMEKGHDEATVASNPRLIGLHTRILATIFNRLSNNKNRTVVIAINQIRSVIGTKYPMTDTPGGHGLKHGKALELKTKVVESITDKSNDKIWAKRVAVHVGKSKVCVPYRTATLTFVIRPDNPYGLPVGPDTYSETIDLAQAEGMLIYSGKAWVLDGQPVLQEDGTPAIKENLYASLYKKFRSEPKYMETLRTKIMDYNTSLEIGL